MKKKIKGFTLAEILGIIVILGVIIILVAPPIIKQLNSKKTETKQTVYDLIYAASSQYMKENPRQYKIGKKYCLSIQDLIVAGKLTSPLIRVDTGENLDNHYVLVSLYSSGDEHYEIMENMDGTCDDRANLPMIDFLVNPSLNEWANEKIVTILYPDGEAKEYKVDDSNWQMYQDKVSFTKNGTLKAHMKYDNNGTIETIESIIDIGKIDSEKPEVKEINRDSDNIIINLSDTGGSGLKGYIVIKNSTAKPTTSSSWVKITPTNDIASVRYKITENENDKYYIYAIDNANNISDVTDWFDVCADVRYEDGTSCTEICGGGTYNRLAYSIHDNSRCPNKDETSGGSACNTFDCCSKTTYEAGVWSSWSDCNKTCGGGKKTRTRDVTIVSAYDGSSCSTAKNSTNTKPSTSESKDCNTSACASSCKPSTSCSCDNTGYGYGNGYNTGYGNGYNTGYGNGYNTGYGNGYNTGYGNGYNTGYGNGYNTGYGNGYNTGYGNGYNTGYGNGYNTGYGNGYGYGNGTCTYTITSCYNGRESVQTSYVSGCEGNSPYSGGGHYTGDSDDSGDPCSSGSTNCDDAGCNCCNSHGAWDSSC